MKLEQDIERLIDQWIKEDIRSGDMTTEACIPEDTIAHAKVVLKQAGTLAGLPFFSLIFKKIAPTIEVNFHVKEGSYHKAGTLIASLQGSARGILSGHRIALNLLQHASGVATITAAYVKKVAGFGCAIMDTRKTLPGLRSLEKYAVRVGGGLNHRFGLDDRFIIKTNHIGILASQFPDPINVAAKKAKEYRPDLPLEIEIDDQKNLGEALKTEAKVIILCNMTPDEAASCIKKIRKTNKKVYVDSSGTITLDTIRAYAELGVDAISIGDLTHSVQALDISLKCQTFIPNVIQKNEANKEK
jgi:nicotinate-nucleotide pyrophosphorylase (carboxylating)